MHVEGARVVITGGSTGIGRATAAALAARGARLVLASRRAERLSETVDALRADGAAVVGVPTDIADLDQVQHLADVTWDELGGADICLFNAGAASGDDLLDPDLDTWRQAIDTNLFGLLHCIKAFIPRLISQGTEASVYATTSGAGIHGTTYQTAPYATAKNAQLTVMECLYGYARDAGAPLHVGVVVPPLTRTNLAGDDLSIWDLVQAGLSKGDRPAPLVEPEEFANVVVAGLERGEFWIEATLEDDEAFFEGRYAPAIRSSRKMIQRKADAAAQHLQPDRYLW